MVRADSPGNKGREVPVPADLVDSLRDLASFHNKDYYQRLMDISRQRIGQVMKDAAREVGTDPGRACLHAFRHTYGRSCVLRGVPIPVLQKWLGTLRRSTRRGTWSWLGRLTSGWPGCEPHLLATSTKLVKPITRGVVKTPVCGPRERGSTSSSEQEFRRPERAELAASASMCFW